MPLIFLLITAPYAGGLAEMKREQEGIDAALTDNAIKRTALQDEHHRKLAADAAQLLDMLADDLSAAIVKAGLLAGGLSAATVEVAQMRSSLHHFVTTTLASLQEHH